VVRLADEQAQLAKAVYTLTNPVAAGLVTEHHHWPGLISALGRMASPRVFKRPFGFFREGGPLPLWATLKLAPLPAVIVHGGMSHPPAPPRARSWRGPTPNAGAQRVAPRASASSRSRAMFDVVRGHRCNHLVNAYSQPSFTPSKWNT